MKRIIRLLIITLILCTPFAGNAAEAEYGIRYAQKFSIKYLPDNIKLVTDSGGKSFLLVPRGAAVPLKYKKLKNTMIVRTPVKKIVICSGGEVSFIRHLDESKKLYDTIAAVTVKENEWNDERMRELMQSGKIIYLSSSMDKEPSAEKIVQLKPDAVFLSGINLGETRLSLVLKGAGIPAVSVGSYTEPSDAGFLEWIKLYGAFFDMDKKADFVFKQMLEEKINFVKKIEKEIEKRKLAKPRVALGFLYYVNGLVYTQSGNARYARYINESGGSYVMENGPVKGAVQIGMEEFFNRCKDADVLIYSSDKRYTPGKKALIAQNSLFAEFKAVKTGRVYLYDESYYLNSIELKEKLEDMIFILHPELMPGHRLKHYEKLPDL